MQSGLEELRKGVILFGWGQAHKAAMGGSCAWTVRSTEEGSLCRPEGKGQA